MTRVNVTRCLVRVGDDLTHEVDLAFDVGRGQPARATAGAEAARAASPLRGGHRDHADGPEPHRAPLRGPHPMPANIHGVLSRIVGAILLVVAVKYTACVVRADNTGEGGILTLLALVLQQQHRGSERRRRALLVALGPVGAALLYGDGIITPPVSVLGAMRGAAADLRRWETRCVPSR